MTDMQSQLNSLLGQVQAITSGIQPIGYSSGSTNSVLSQLSQGYGFQPSGDILSGLLQGIYNQGQIYQASGSTFASIENSVIPGFVSGGAIGTGLIAATLAGNAGAFQASNFMGGLAIGQEGFNQTTDWQSIVDLANSIFPLMG